MLNLEQILPYYPKNLHDFKERILSEYLQYKLLKIIFDSKYSGKLSFLGGTALRIVHNNTRFSEDLDFDNFGLTKEEFEEIAQLVQRTLLLEGYEVEVRNVFKGAFRCYVKFGRVLFDNKLTLHQSQKINIQVDTVAHNFEYEPENKLLDKFDVYSEIKVTPLDILLSQKICAAFGRKRFKGRDFYDLVFLLSLGVKPNYKYLNVKLAISDGEPLKKFILEKSAELDFKYLANDVKQFLFNEGDKRRVEMFLTYIKNFEF